MNLIGTVFDTIEFGNRTVNLTVREGEVLSSRTHAGNEIRTSRRGKKVKIHNIRYEETAVWVRWENGEEEELPAIRDAVTALGGHKLRVVSAERNGTWFTDLVRINQNTGQWSAQTGEKPFARALANQALGLNYWAVTPMLMALILGSGMMNLTSNIPWSFGGFIACWVGMHLSFNRSFNKARKSIVMRLPALVAEASRVKLNDAR